MFSFDNSDVAMTREELYELVWTTPIYKLAEKLGLSDQGLAKKCKKHHIPRPPVGYWQKLEAGKRVKRPPLPKITAPLLQQVVFHHNDGARNSGARKLESISDKDPRLLVARNFIFPEHINRYYPAIKQFRDAVDFKRVDRYGFLIPNRLKQVALDIKVSKSSYDRTCRFLQALFKLFDEVGWKVKVIKNERYNEERAYIVIGEEVLSFRIKEKIRQVKHELTDYDKTRMRESKYYKPDKYDFSPTNILSFRIENVYAHGGAVTKWSDTSSQPLEQQWESVVIGFIHAAEIHKENRLERERAEKRREEERKQEAKLRHSRETEGKQIRLLMEAAQSFNQAEIIRNLIRSIEDRIADKSEDLSQWLIWAENVANSMDPVSGIDKVLKEHKKISNMPFFDYRY